MATVMVQLKVSRTTNEMIERLQREIQRQGLNSVLDEKTQKPLFTRPPSKGDVVEVAIRILKEKTGL